VCCICERDLGHDSEPAIKLGRHLHSSGKRTSMDEEGREHNLHERAYRDRLRQPQRSAGIDYAMTVTIGSLTFDHASYDDRGDVLYLHVGDRQPATVSDETPEGHVLRYNAKWLLERGHVINVTVPEHVAVSPDTLAEALAAA
jgi:hypothetical protein